MAKRTRMGITGSVLRGLDALSATSGADAPGPAPRPVLRERRGPAPDPGRAELVPVLYRVRPEDRDALRDEAARRARKAREAADEERRRARLEGRKPRPITVREDASEVLREILAAWRGRARPGPTG